MDAEANLRDENKALGARTPISTSGNSVVVFRPIEAISLFDSEYEHYH